MVRVENLEDATEHVPMVLDKCKPEYLVRETVTITNLCYSLMSLMSINCIPYWFIIGIWV